jgi:pyrroloquinoline quinone biosynthesis protein D
MIDGAARIRLAAKARLRFDRRGQQYMLLYPEKGLALSPTAAEIVRLCTGELTVAGMVDRLAQAHGGQAREAIEADVLRFLASLAERGLLAQER